MLRILIICFFAPSTVFAQDLVRLFILPTAPVRLDWDSPRALVTSLLKGGIMNKNHAIGHVNIEISCSGGGGNGNGNGVSPGRYALTGSVTQDKSQSIRFLFAENVGFSILAAAWPGRLEPVDEILSSLRARHRERTLSAVTFAVSPAACARAYEFFAMSSRDQHPRYYGFAARPRRHEGAGCTAYAAALLEVAGLFSDPVKAAWRRSVNVPLTLMTGFDGSPESVSVWKVLRTEKGKRWATPDEPRMELDFYDPDRMHEWAGALAASGPLDAALETRFPGLRAAVVDERGARVPDDRLFIGPQNLFETQERFYLRGDLEFAPDGSFTMTPEN